MGRKHHRPDLRRSERALDWLSFFVADVQTGFGPFVAVYLAASGWTTGEIGLALTAGGGAAIASQMPGGALVDSVAMKRLLVAVALGMIATAALLIAFRPHFVPVFAAAFSTASLGYAVQYLGYTTGFLSLAVVGLLGSACLYWLFPETRAK